MSSLDLRLSDAWFAGQLGAAIAEARTLIGWDQRELAERARTSQASISRLETGRARAIDLLVVARVLIALGIRGTMGLDAPHLRDRRRQRDPVHARLVAYVARRLERHGWRVATEVPIGDPEPRGWIDLLAFRPVDGAGLVGEAKADLPDIGELQRQVGFYARAAAWAARPLGWQLERTAIIVTGLDSLSIRGRVAANRATIERSFPGRATDLTAWIGSPMARPPTGPTFALVDPASRRTRWLQPPGGRSASTPPYLDYADAVRRLGRIATR